MKILITGATGFIGGHLVKNLAMDDNNELFCIVREPSSLRQQRNITCIAHDFLQKLDFAALPQKLDAIVHLAQSRNYRNFPEKTLDIFDVNVASTVQLLDYGRRAGIGMFVYASTGGIHGYRKGLIAENDQPAPLGFYAYSKYLSECLIRTYYSYFSTCVLRYYFVYGVGQRDMMIPNLINSIMVGKPIVIHNESGRRLNPIYADDAVKATIAALSIKGNETINVAGDEVITMLALSNMLGQLLGKKPVFDFLQEKNPIDIAADITRMKLKLGIKPSVSLKEGLSKVVSNTLKR